MLILFQILRRTTRIAIKDEAIWKIAELMAYAMFFNLFLLGAEVFKEFYSATEHLVYTQLPLFSGIGGHHALVPYAWLSLVLRRHARSCCSSFPATRRNCVTLNLGLPADLRGRLHREGHGPGHPGHDARHAGRDLRVPADLVEWMVAAGIFGVGFLVFTLLSKVAIEICSASSRSPARAGRRSG